MAGSMHRAALIGIALAMAAVASPIAAQQTAPEPPPASTLPPPPPFPPYPKVAPREHNPNYRKATHTHRSSAKAHHAAKSSHHAKAKHNAKAKHHAKAARHAKRMYFSKRTIRQCHAMTYKQIMSHVYCRTMMRQDLEAKARAAHHAKHHRAKHRTASAHHRQAARHRR